MQSLGRAGEVQLFSHGEKAAKVAQFHTLRDDLHLMTLASHADPHIEGLR
ncbi:hypothetical protein ANT2_2645 [plant metagenome]|uniref:Uncharacterized protein n=1 Tax=plant metagenome TaxID=1297885 RepID=A0A484RK11_9ZZZZ